MEKTPQNLWWMVVGSFILAFIIGGGAGYGYWRFSNSHDTLSSNNQIGNQIPSEQELVFGPLPSMFSIEGEKLFWFEYDLTPLEGFDDINSLETIGSTYFLRDSNSIYTHDVPDGRYRKIPEADRNSFNVIHMWDYNVAYSKDANHVFYKDKVLVDADLETFVALKFPPNDEGQVDGSMYSKDKNRVYKGLQVIENADPATFTLVAGMETHDAQDKNNRYLDGEIIFSEDEIKALSLLMKTTSVEDIYPNSKWGSFYSFSASYTDGEYSNSVSVIAKKQPDGTFVVLLTTQDEVTCTRVIEKQIPRQIIPTCVDSKGERVANIIEG